MSPEWKKNANFSQTKQFRATVSIDDLQSKMGEIGNLENRHDVIIFCQGWSDLDNISQTGSLQNDMSTAVKRGNGNQM